jgi:hypothetical protein
MVRPLWVEVCFLVGADETVLWSDRGTAGALPDSTERWQAIWRHRDELAVIAHTHPGGLLAFSEEDRTTMAAIDDALGRSMRYAVVTDRAVLYRDPDGSVRVAAQEPGWAPLLRAASSHGTANGEVADGDSQHHVPGALG